MDNDNDVGVNALIPEFPAIEGFKGPELPTGNYCWASVGSRVGECLSGMASGR